MGGLDRIHHLKQLEKRRQEALLGKWNQKSEENKKRVDQPISETKTTAFFREADPSGMDENVTIEDLEDDNDDSASFEIHEAKPTKPHLYLHLGFSEKNQFLE